MLVSLKAEQPIAKFISVLHNHLSTQSPDTELLKSIQIIIWTISSDIILFIPCVTSNIYIMWGMGKGYNVMNDFK